MDAIINDIDINLQKFIKRNIEDNILDDFEPKEFRELSCNLEFYLKDTEFEEIFLGSSLDKLKHLFKLLSNNDEGYPRGFVRNTIKIDTYSEFISLVNKPIQFCYEQDGYLQITPLMEQELDAGKFKDTLKEMRRKLPEGMYIKVYKNYSQNKNYLFNNQSGYSINKDGELKNILNVDDKSVNDVILIRDAINHGAVKARSYAYDYSRYVKGGYYPVAICKWDDEDAPVEWIKLNNFKDDSWKNKPDDEFTYPRQDIIFYIFNNTETSMTLNEFWEENGGYDASYNDAILKQQIAYNKIVKGN